MTEIQAGSIIDSKYELLEEVGAGGMGLVYKAKQQGLDRIVAIKILEPTLVSDTDSLARFEREARSISLLNHVHIASFFSYGIHNTDAPYIAMEFLEGKNLKTLIQEPEDGLEWKRSLQICLQICDAMEYAHSQGVVHRDLKPNNIILLPSPQPDWVKVVDFGLAKLADLTESGKQRLTKTGELLGSVDYLSPEQCLGRQTDQRSDIYSLACILFEMLTGRTPFESDNPIGQIHKHANEESPLITTVSQKLFPPGLELLIKKALSKDPAERYQSMAELAADVRLILEGKGGELLATLEKYKQGKIAKTGVNKSLVISACICIAVLAIAGGAGWFYLTDSGICYQARMALTSNHDTKTRLAWLIRADELEKAGKAQTAQILRAEVMHPFEANNENDFGLANMYLTLAREYKRKGDASLAAKAGWQALQEMFKVSRPEAFPSVPTDRSVRYLTAIEDASLLALLRPDKYTKTEAGMLQKLARPMMNVPGPFTLNLVDLLERVMDDSRMPLNEDTVECYRLRASNASARVPADLPRIRRATIKASKEALRLKGPLSATASQSWSESAMNLAARNQPIEALKYAKKADTFFDAVEPKTDNYVLFGSMTNNINAYISLGMPDKAEELAKKQLQYACSQNNECAFCAQAHEVSARVALKTNAAEGAKRQLRAARLYGLLDYTDNPEALKEYSNVIYKLIKIMEGNKLPADLESEIRTELKHARQIFKKQSLDQSVLGSY